MRDESRIPTPPGDGDDGPPVDPDEVELVAYLDGELDSASVSQLEARLAADPALRARATALKKTYDLLDFLPRPEASANFTSKTLDKIPAVQKIPRPGAATVPTSAAETPASAARKVSVPPAGPVTVAVRGGRGWRLAAGIMLVVLLGAVGGVLGRTVAHTLRPDEAPAVAEQSPEEPATKLDKKDAEVAGYLPLYEAADDVNFIRALGDLGFAEVGPGIAATPEREPWGGLTDDPERTARQEAAFAALPRATQRRILQIHHDLQALDPATRAPLYRTLEAYAAWVNRLSDAERRTILDAPNGAERLKRVAAVQEQDWQAHLPGRVRSNREDLKQWKQAEEQRRRAWGFGPLPWDSTRGGRAPWPFNDPALRSQVIAFATAAYHPDEPARSPLSHEEQAWLRQAYALGKDQNVWFWYGKALYDLRGRYEMLPEWDPKQNPTVTEIKDLPTPIRSALKEKPGAEARVAVKAGKWPDFALAVYDELGPAATLKADGTQKEFFLGPCRQGQFKPEMRAFFSDLRHHTRADEFAQLESRQGKWPDYPRRMIELAKASGLSVPGAMLPGPAAWWDQIYGGRPAARAAKR